MINHTEKLTRPAWIVSSKKFTPERFALLCLLIAAILTIGTVFSHSHSGFDFTDEGLYLIWMSNPWQYAISVSQFGYIYHPIYLLAQGDIGVIRQFIYLITLILASFLGQTVLNMAFDISKFDQGKSSYGYAVILAATALLLTCFELAQSPSYNSLTFQAILLGAAGALMASKTASGSIRLGYALMGISWWLAFMAKPPSALMLGLITMIYLLFSKKFNSRLFFCSAVIAFLLLLGSAIVIDGSVLTFVERFRKSLEIGKLLGGGNNLSSMWRWDSFPLQGSALYLLVGLACLLGSLIVLASRIFKISSLIIVGTSLASTIFAVLLFFNYIPLHAPFERYTGLHLLAIPMGGLIVLIVAKTNFSVKKEKFTLGIFIFALSFAYAFGTDRPYWLNAEGASVFWVLGGIVFASAIQIENSVWRQVIPVCSFSIALTTLFIFSSLEFPMRQTQALRLNTEVISIGKEGHTLRMSKDFASYISELRSLAYNAGFIAGTPIIDLTGSSPGVVYALNAKAPGSAWLLGGYQGSEAFAAASLDLATCADLAKAWVLTAPSGQANLPNSILSRYGLDLQSDFDDLGSAKRPPTPFPKSYSHHLLKPRRSFEQAQTACTIKVRERV